MQEAYQLARKKINERGIKAKKTYDRWVRSSILQPGDLVLVRNLSQRGGPGKQRSFWENDIHVVVRWKGPGSPVYEVDPENGGRKNRILHRNLLLPCDYLPVENPQPDTVRPVLPATRRSRQPKPSSLASRNEEISSDEEFPDLVTVLSPRNTGVVSPPRNPTPSETETAPDIRSEGETTLASAELPEDRDVLQLEQHNDQVEDVNVPGGDQENGAQHGNNVNHQPEIHIPVGDPRPRRTRYPPDRLTYYEHGETAPTGLFQISTTTPTTGWQPPQLPNSPYPLVPLLFLTLPSIH